MMRRKGRFISLIGSILAISAMVLLVFSTGFIHQFSLIHEVDIHLYILLMFIGMTFFNRHLIKQGPQMNDIVKYILPWRRLLLFPGLPNGFPASNISFQERLILNTTLSLILVFLTERDINLIVLIGNIAVNVKLAIKLTK